MHIESANGFTKDDVLQKLASVERASEHPLALAVVNDAQERKLRSPMTDFDSRVETSVGTVEGVQAVSGSGKFLAECGIEVAGLDQLAEEQRSKAATLIFVGSWASFERGRSRTRPTTLSSTSVSGNDCGWSRWSSRRAACRGMAECGRRRPQYARRIANRRFAAPNRRRRQDLSARTPHVRCGESVQRLGWAAQLALVLNGMNMPAGLSR